MQPQAHPQAAFCPPAWQVDSHEVSHLLDEDCIVESLSKLAARNLRILLERSRQPLHLLFERRELDFRTCLPASTRCLDIIQADPHVEIDVLPDHEVSSPRLQKTPSQSSRTISSSTWPTSSWTERRISLAC